MPDQKQQKINFVLNNEAPRFGTRILITVNNQTAVLSFGLENPGSNQDVLVHTRVAMPMENLKGLRDLIDRVLSDTDAKDMIKNLQYSEIPSDS